MIRQAPDSLSKIAILVHTPEGVTGHTSRSTARRVEMSGS